MFIADLHCDTISALYALECENKPASLLENHLQVDLKKMKKGNYLLQNFAVYVDWGVENDPYASAKGQISLFLQQMKQYSDMIRQVRNFKELEENHKNGIMSALLTLEEGEICQGDLKKLEEMYNLGVRIMTFTWNYENSLGSPAVFDEKRKPLREEGGLTETGLSFLEKMEQLGIVADVSHLSDKGVEDVLAYGKKPVMASHSNARSLCNYPRNLSDWQIRGIAQKGGIIGINYYGKFLTEEKTGGGYFSRIEDMVRHIRYIADIGGMACVGLGSDFDGMDDNLELKDASHMELLVKALKEHGFSNSEAEAVCYKNVWNFYKECFR